MSVRFILFYVFYTLLRISLLNVIKEFVFYFLLAFIQPRYILSKIKLMQIDRQLIYNDR